MSYRNTIAVYHCVCNLLCFYTDDVERAIRNVMKRPMYMNKSRLNESILDNVEQTSADIFDVISDNEYGDFRYMLVIPGDPNGGFSYKDKDIAVARTEQAIKSLGVDCKVECYSKDEYNSLGLKMKYDLNWVRNIVCIKYDYPDNLPEQIKFVYRMLYAYYLNFRSYIAAYMFKYQNGKYVYTERNAIIEPIIQLYGYLKDFCRFGDIDRDVLISAVSSISSLLPIKITVDNRSRVLNIVRIIIKQKRKRWIISESILDNVERTSADSAAELSSGKSTDDDEDRFDFYKYERFTHMFIFCVSSENNGNSSLTEFLNARGIDYEILQVTSEELRNIEWINHSITLKNEPDTYLCIFINPPVRMYYRLRLMMGICSAVCDDYNDAVSNDIYKYVQEDVPDSYEKQFICRAIARGVVVRSDELNNYFNGGDAYSERNDSYVQFIINNWKNNIVYMLNYAYSDRTVLSAIDRALAMLNARLEKIKKRRNISD